jgi:hypothetical protein
MIAQDRIRTRSEEERDAGARFAAVACAAARLSFPRADSDAAPFLKRDPRISFGLARPSRCSSQLPAPTFQLSTLLGMNAFSACSPCTVIAFLGAIPACSTTQISEPLAGQIGFRANETNPARFAVRRPPCPLGLPCPQDQRRHDEIRA